MPFWQPTGGGWLFLPLIAAAAFVITVPGGFVLGSKRVPSIAVGRAAGALLVPLMLFASLLVVSRTGCWDCPLSGNRPVNVAGWTDVRGSIARYTDLNDETQGEQGVGMAAFYGQLGLILIGGGFAGALAGRVIATRRVERHSNLRPPPPNL